MAEPTHEPGQLKRQIGVFHAVLLGLGSILGTGVFVSIGIAAGIAGPAVLVAIVLAGLLALCNGLSSAQLAAAHPVAGGTYEYGYKYLHPKLGFTAGWMFLLAKSASAATAALGVAWFALRAVRAVDQPGYIHGVFAVLLILVVTVIVLSGIRRSARVNAIIVSITLLGLIAFLAGATQSLFEHRIWGFSDLDALAVTGKKSYLHNVILATPLMFVAFTGYGRIATLGEEVHDPQRTIPNAIIATLAVSMAVYFAVGIFVALTAGKWLPTLESALFQAPGIRSNPTVVYSIDYVAMTLRLPTWLVYLVGISGITAMLGVLLNLILGLSRVALAMGRRRDLPGLIGGVNMVSAIPVPAVILVAVIICLLASLGNVKATWSFSAFTVLIYYGITNLAALNLPIEHRLYPRFFAWAGLGGCLFLAWWVEPVYWIVGSGLIVVGLLWHSLAPRIFGRPPRRWERCEQCGYDLRASSGTCPECGAEIPPPPEPYVMYAKTSKPTD